MEYTMEYHGVSWNIMECHGIYYGIDYGIYYGIYYGTYYGISWNIIDYYGVSWNMRRTCGGFMEVQAHPKESFLQMDDRTQSSFTQASRICGSA